MRSFSKALLKSGHHQANSETEGDQLGSDLQPYSVWATAICVYLCLNVDLFMCVKCRSQCGARKCTDSPTRRRNHREILRWFVSFLCRCLSKSLSLLLLLLLLFLSFFVLSHTCLYVIVYRDLLRIRDRKPIYRGYLRKVSLFVCCEIETLPSAALSLSPSLSPPLSNCLSLNLSLSGGHNTTMKERWEER